MPAGADIRGRLRPAAASSRTAAGTPSLLLVTVVGLVGDVVVRVRGGGSPGEVVLVVDGQRETYLAYAHEPVPVGRRVLVIGDRGDRAVDVEPWDIDLPR
jgi:hypothetical protein